MCANRVGKTTEPHELGLACLPACAAAAHSLVPPAAGFAASCKTVFVMALLKNLVKEGHRTLIFSQSRVM